MTEDAWSRWSTDHVLRSARRMSFLEAIVGFRLTGGVMVAEIATGGGDSIGEGRGDGVILAGVVSRWQARMSGPGILTWYLRPCWWTHALPADRLRCSSRQPQSSLPVTLIHAHHSQSNTFSLSLPRPVVLLAHAAVAPALPAVRRSLCPTLHAPDTTMKSPCVR
jgi:hypothetical protein